MDDGQEMQIFVHHLKSVCTELSFVIKKNKLKGIIIFILLSIQIFCLVVFVQSISRVTRDLKVMSTLTKRFSPSDLPVFTFCSKQQYR